MSSRIRALRMSGVESRLCLQSTVSTGMVSPPPIIYIAPGHPNLDAQAWTSAYQTHQILFSPLKNIVGVKISIYEQGGRRGKESNILTTAMFNIKMVSQVMFSSYNEKIQLNMAPHIPPHEFWIIC